jgi:hypothetical protein
VGIGQDVVKGRVLQTYPDGSVKQEQFNGPLTLEVTNKDTNNSVNVNASGAAVVDFAPDGSQVWHTNGPVLFGFRIGANSNHSAGLFLLTGNFTVEIGPTARNVTDARGSERDICAELT